MMLSEDQIQALIKLASSQLELDQLRQAEKSFQTLLRLMPAQPEALYGLAEIARRKRKPRKQREWLEELVSVHPHHLAGVLALARLLGESHPQLALPYLERSLDILPDAGELLLQTASCLQKTGDAEKARFWLEQLVASQPLGPHSAEAWVMLAQLDLRSGELGRAAEAFERAARLDPAIKADSRWIDVEGRWNALAARSEALDWQGVEQRLEGR